ncbi:MAG TPA: DUF6777 domain-containing protein [Gaiellaceae bacterium]|jgi:hypothetical protein|nr:DUF6777 domain-containing protein [Gaiellaceae bacterium]
MLDDPGPVAGSGPTYIGRYRSERVVGSGAFATVWLAEDETLAAPVAIKVLAENWAHDEEVRQRFLEEARILWRANSDHIVRIHNVDELPDGRPYFVMDFADRGTLQDRMRGRIQSGGRYSVEEAIALSLAIADGLKVAHGLGVVHRDLKPANIMFQSVPAHLGDSRDEKLILTDFGMAKSVARARGTTIATGTPYYMAPEQTEGRADERSDIYSAGVVLYELLAGRVPYPYDSPGRLFAAQVAEPPTPITSLRDDVPPALADTLNHALASDPDERWPTADAWANALEAAAKGEPATPPVPLPGVDPDVLKTMGPAEVAAAKAAAQELPAATPPPAAAAPVAAAAAAVPPPAAPPPAAPPPPSSGDEGRRKRKRALAIGGPVALIALGVVAAVLAIVLTGAKNADAKTLTLDPISALGTNPFTASIVPAKNASTANLPLPKNIPAQLLGSSTATTISNTDLRAKLGPIYTALLANLNPPIGALSGLKLPLSNGLKNTADDRPRIFTGSAPGLYGGTQILTVCDRRQMIAFLERNEDKLKAWAAVQGISPSDVPLYISTLTDVVLQFDTRVTNHGYIDGKANPIDEVLQKGTAVLIDKYGIPRARCYCGNPLTPPRTLAKNVTVVLGGGLKKPWPGFSIGKTVDPTKGKSTPELGLIDVVTGTTAIYRRIGTPPDAGTLVPQIVQPIPGSTTPTAIAVASSSPPTTTPPTTTPPTTTPPTTAPPPPPATPVNVTSDGTATASSEFSSQFPASNGVDGNLATSWFSVGSKEGDTSTFTWTSTHGAILVDHITLYSNSQNSIANVRSGYTFTSVQVSVLHNGVVTASTTVPYPSVSVTVPLGHVGDTVKLLLIHHTNPACGGFGELEVFGSPVSSGGPAAPAAQSSADAVALVKSVLDKAKNGCGLTYTTVTAVATSNGWNVTAKVTTRGGPNTAHYGVVKGSSAVSPEDQVSFEILHACQ